jgi:hypothetical protein
MPRRLIAVASVVVLALIVMARTTPAWSATTCPATLVAPSTHLPSAGDCGEEHLEEDEERIEEELEVREDEEEERAIAAERAARAATDAEEEAAEEAQEHTGREAATLHVPNTKPSLGLRVKVLTRHGHSLISPGETRISVTTSVPAQVKLLLQAPGGPAKLFRGETTEGRKYVLRVPWTCHTRTRRYTFTVTAYREGDSQIGAGTVRRRAFTTDAHVMSGGRRCPEAARRLRPAGGGL